MTNGAGVELEPIWASLLAKALEGKNVKDLLLNVGSGGGAPASGAAPAAAGGAAAAEAPKEEEKKEEEKEESDDDMVRLRAFSAPEAGCLHACAGLRSLRLSVSSSLSYLCPSCAPFCHYPYVHMLSCNIAKDLKNGIPGVIISGPPSAEGFDFVVRAVSRPFPFSDRAGLQGDVPDEAHEASTSPVLGWKAYGLTGAAWDVTRPHSQELTPVRSRGLPSPSTVKG